MYREELVIQAIQFASEAHIHQKYGKLPYSHHLESVVGVLERFGISDPELLAAGALHDILEDVPEVSFGGLAGKFGQEVAELVLAVTDEPGKSRDERHARTYPKIREKKLAILIKLADRIANVEHSLEAKDPKLTMYRKEHRGFKCALYDDQCTPALRMWELLDQLLGF